MLFPSEATFGDSIEMDSISFGFHSIEVPQPKCNYPFTSSVLYRNLSNKTLNFKTPLHRGSIVKLFFKLRMAIDTLRYDMAG
jgi:hypothetical protein